MNHVAKFIVKYRIAIAAIFVAIAAVCAIATMQVKINKDMTQYLPSDMQVKIGMDVMAEEFGESSQLRLMTKGVSHEDCKQLADDLAAFELVSSVSYEADSPDYNQDDYSLLFITVEGNSFSEEAQRAFEAVEKACALSTAKTKWKKLTTQPDQNRCHRSVMTRYTSKSL